MQEYENFIFNKSTSVISSGFDINKKELNENLYEFQKDIVRWALKKGKAKVKLEQSSLFEDMEE